MGRVLFIDDDVLALQLMSRVTSLLGYQALLSSEPDSALDLAAREKPGLIVVDMLMTEMDGTEFVSRLRQSPEISHLPVLIYSAGTGQKDEERARSAGADGFLLKPVGLEELSQVFRHYLGAASPA